MNIQRNTILKLYYKNVRGTLLNTVRAGNAKIKCKFSAFTLDL